MALSLDHRQHPRFANRDAQTAQLFTQLVAATDELEAERIVEQITTLYLDLCSTMAGRYAGRGVDHEDLVQVACLALVTAIRRYRPGSGPSFAAYAVPTISGELKRYFRDRGWMVRPPRRVQELRADLAAERERMEQELGHTPTDDELAEAVDISTDEVREVAAAVTNYHPMSLDCSPSDDEKPALSNFLACSDTAMEMADDRVCLSIALGELDEDERELVLMRYVEGRTQREIGEARGVSQMQVSRMLRRITSGLAQRLGPESMTATHDVAS
jgi:RNA polymerase sigma-B factor